MLAEASPWGAHEIQLKQEQEESVQLEPEAWGRALAEASQLANSVMMPDANSYSPDLLIRIDRAVDNIVFIGIECKNTKDLRRPRS